ncbi:MAG: RNA polymerase sigma factor SigJ [Paludisphaera borealis]|uniref:RNA polymerase sigma factor SigJ n=1 Tax=Paludisphaera borealis TaxID=1387353 RepID=UPI00284B939A|nr:RNA polymerase sigma factor SigJ [Paludisphaera borealis]MDR3618502.1 RNA polymerase sigma factor SigJ [Paludisphaera borealis]
MNADLETSETDVERMRPRLLALAYRMLGSAADAEDAVQDAYLRYQQVSDVAAPDAWLVKATTRLCIDRLRQAKRRETYFGPWLPEPVAETWAGAGDDSLELAESLSMAFLVLLETLSPSERAAYLLREVFGYEFEEIAALLDKTPVNVRQIVARARKHVDNKDRRFRSTAEQAEDLAARFFDACRSGDVHAIESLLTPDAVLYSDGGGKVHAAPRPLTDPRQIAKLLAVTFRKFYLHCDESATIVNGRPGVFYSASGKAVSLVTFAENRGSVGTLYVVLNPDKLERWSFSGPEPINDTASEPQS